MIIIKQIITWNHIIICIRLGKKNSQQLLKYAKINAISSTVGIKQPKIGLHVIIIDQSNF